MGKRYRRLQGSTAYYPFAARTGLRARQKRRARGLWLAGTALLALAAVLFLREKVMHGGQPAPPAVVQASSEQAGPSAAPHGSVHVEPVAATRDVLAETADADERAHTAPEAAPTAAPQQVQQVLPQYQALYAQNPDLAGWLCIDGTKIDLPVMQTPHNNEYYLRRGFDRLYATGGTLFLDARCSLSEPSTANWLVYGHNMTDGSMFGTLARYEDPAFWREHPTFRFDTLYETGTWQVVAALRTTLGADALPYYAFFDAQDRASWQKQVDAMLSLALYDTGVTPQYGDQLLTLSTCGNTDLHTSARFAVLAIRVEE